MSLKKVHDNQPKDFKFTDENLKKAEEILKSCLLYTSPSPRDGRISRMPSSA